MFYEYNLFIMPIDNLLFLYGNDEFAIARRLNELQSRHDKDGMNTARLEARTVSEEELNNAVNAMPFLSEKRLVFLANPSARTSVPAARTEIPGLPPGRAAVHAGGAVRTGRTEGCEKHWLVKARREGRLQSREPS